MSFHPGRYRLVNWYDLDPAGAIRDRVYAGAIAAGDANGQDRLLELMLTAGVRPQEVDRRAGIRLTRAWHEFERRARRRVGIPVEDQRFGDIELECQAALDVVLRLILVLRDYANPDDGLRELDEALVHAQGEDRTQLLHVRRLLLFLLGRTKEFHILQKALRGSTDT